MFSIRQLSRRARRPTGRRAQPRRRPVLRVEYLEDRNLLAVGVTPALAVPLQSPLSASTPGQFGQLNPGQANQNLVVVGNTGALPGQNQAANTFPGNNTGVVGSTQPGSTGGNTGIPTGLFTLGAAASTAVVPGQQFLGTTSTGNMPTAAQSLVAAGFNPFTGGQPLVPGGTTTNLAPAFQTAPVLGTTPPVLTPGNGTLQLPFEQSTLPNFRAQYITQWVLLGSGGGNNRPLIPQNPQAIHANGEQEEQDVPPVDDGGVPADGEQQPPMTPAPADGGARPDMAPAPVNDGEVRPLLLAEPEEPAKLPAWEITAQAADEVFQAPEQLPAAPAVETPVPMWIRLLSAASFAAGTVGSVWAPKFAAPKASREELLRLRRDANLPR